MADEAKTIADLPAATGGIVATDLLEIQRGTGTGASQKVPFSDVKAAILDGPVVIPEGDLRVQNFNGVPTDGVVRFGNANSFLYKQGGNFTFRNIEGDVGGVPMTATLNSPGTIVTSANISEYGSGPADSGWIAPTLENGWTNNGGGFAEAGYRKVGTLVFIRGLIKTGTFSGGTVLFTLPTGYRPAHTRMFLGFPQEGICRVDISASDGALRVYPIFGSNALFSLEGMIFHTD